MITSGSSRRTAHLQLTFKASLGNAGGMQFEAGRSKRLSKPVSGPEVLWRNVLRVAGREATPSRYTSGVSSRQNRLKQPRM